MHPASPPAATATSATATIGTLISITQRQSAYSVSSPPNSTPLAPPAALTALHTPSARNRARPSGNVVVRVASAAGATAAAATPCTARAATNCHGSCANPPAAEAIPNTINPPVKIRRRPNRSHDLPPSNRNPPKASA